MQHIIAIRYPVIEIALMVWTNHKLVMLTNSHVHKSAWKKYLYLGNINS